MRPLLCQPKTALALCTLFKRSRSKMKFVFAWQQRHPLAAVHSQRQPKTEADSNTTKLDVHSSGYVSGNFRSFRVFSHRYPNRQVRPVSILFFSNKFFKKIMDASSNLWLFEDLLPVGLRNVWNFVDTRISFSTLIKIYWITEKLI